jgi:phospholipid/cholesterol/gamma-HCH transport system permease protein
MNFFSARLLTPASNYLKFFFKDMQELSLLAFWATVGVFRRPLYIRETIEQMDLLGVGSLAIVVLTGLFAGMALSLQLVVELVVFGAQSYLGRAVAVSIVREMGPVLTALMVAGRICAGITAELGSMNVSQQIDALRVLGADPVKKLVVPRMISVIIMLPVLTVISDAVALIGGYAVAVFISRQSSPVYWSSASQAFNFQNLLGGVIKPFVFGFIIAIVGSHYGLQTEGGTKGVGRYTTHAVVVASILILVSNFLITKLLISLYGWRT